MGMGTKPMVPAESGEEILEVNTESSEETLRLGQVLGNLLQKGSVVALLGELGTGKTVLAKGLAKGLGVQNEREITSPSFVLVNEYHGRIPVYHLDLYRLQSAEQIEDLDWEEFISGSGVTIVEWAEKAARLLPPDRIDVHLRWVSLQERKLVFIGKGQGGREAVVHLGGKWNREE